MKKSMIVMMMIVIAFSMNLFGEIVNGKTAEHVCTNECNHNEEVKKECGPNCTKPCCADKKVEENHMCNEKCEIAKKHVCTDECKLDDINKTCELAVLKTACSDAEEKQGCNPKECEQNPLQKGCKKL